MMEKPFYDAGLAFECTQCHACCRHDPGFVFLSNDDLKRLCQSHGLSAAAFIEKYCRWVDMEEGQVLCLREKKNFDCIFWDGGCTVYGSRPIQCQTYPFWKTPLQSKESWKWEGRFCPGIGRGKLHSPQEIREALVARQANPPIRKEEF